MIRLPRSVRLASACRFCVSVVRNWTSGAVWILTSKRIPPSSPVFAVEAGGGVAADASIEPMSRMRVQRHVVNRHLPETRLREVVPFRVSLRARPGSSPIPDSSTLTLSAFAVSRNCISGPP